MKRILVLIVVLALLASALTLPAAAVGESFEYSLETTSGGKTVTDLTVLPNGTEVTVTVTLICTNLLTDDTYEAWGIELDIADLGLDYVSGSGFTVILNGKETAINPSNYVVGGATGTGIIRFYTITNSPYSTFDVAQTVSVSANYVITDNTIAQVTAPSPIIYLKGETDEADVKPAESVTPIVVPPYIVTLDAAGGELSSANLYEVEKGASMVLPEPVYEGFIFGGWSDGTNTFAAGSNYTPSSDVTLTATWTPGDSEQPVQYTIVFDANGGVLEGESSATVAKDTEITLPAATFDGHTFIGWSDGADVYEADATYMVINNITLTAVWKEDGQPEGSSEGITVRVLDTTNGITAEGIRDQKGIVTISAVNVFGNPVASVPGGMLVKIENAGIGNVAAIIDSANGRVIDIIEKSYVDNGTAYVLLDSPESIRIIDNAKLFDDVSARQWFNGAVVFASSHELFQGVSSTEFAPGKEMTRGMLVTVLWRLEGKPAGTGTRFDDVPDGLYYSEAVRWAAGIGVVNGYGDGTFLPDENITREQLAAVFYRYMNYLGYDTSARAGLNSFSDGGKVSGWAVDSIKWSVAEGIVTGRSDGTIDPQGNATRAEVATLVMRIVKAMVK